MAEERKDEGAQDASPREEGRLTRREALKRIAAAALVGTTAGVAAGLTGCFPPSTPTYYSVTSSGSGSSASRYYSYRGYTSSYSSVNTYWYKSGGGPHIYYGSTRY